jgi:hypothetical protein
MANALVKFGGKVKDAIPAIVAQKGDYKTFVVDKVTRYGATAGFSYVKGRYREKALIKGQPVDLVLGSGAMGLAVVSELLLGGLGSSTLNRIGDAGLQSYIGSRFTALGHKHAGRKLYVSEPGANPALPAGLKQVDVLGEHDAMGGVFLSDAEVQRFASAR